MMVNIYKVSPQNIKVVGTTIRIGIFGISNIMYMTKLSLAIKI